MKFTVSWIDSLCGFGMARDNQTAADVAKLAAELTAKGIGFTVVKQ